MTLVARITHAAVTAAILAIVVGCSSDDPGPRPSEPTSSSTAEPPAITEPDLSQTPATFDGATHTLHITIRDVDELRAYVKDDWGRCVAPLALADFSAAELAEQAEVLLPMMIVSDESGEELATKHGPILGEPGPDGSCVAEVSIVVPRRTQYTLGLAVEGVGILDPDAPVYDNPFVIRRGTEQHVDFTY